MLFCAANAKVTSMETAASFPRTETGISKQVRNQETRNVWGFHETQQGD